MLVAINAQDKNRLIGNGMNIPWHIREEFLHFKNTTMGHKMIMGLTTFKSIGKPLPGRETIIIHFNKDFDNMGCEVVTDLMEVVRRYKDTEEVVFVCGGASIYRQLLPYCEKLIISEVKGDYEGDVYFPEYKNMFKVTDTVEKEQFTIYYYDRIH